MTQDAVNHNSRWAEVNEMFENMSRPINEMQESVIGDISRVSDSKLRTIANKIFNPQETDIEVIKNAKSVIKSVDPDAWNEILRARVQSQINTVPEDLLTESVENFPGRLFNALFRNENGSKILIEAADGETKKKLGYLRVVLNRARQ